jgi:hypothetical protein
VESRITDQNPETACTTSNLDESSGFLMQLAGIVINFGDVDLVLEGADSPEDAIVVQRGEIQFLATEDVGFYRAVNSGSINVWVIDFVYSETSLSCVCPELDKSASPQLAVGSGGSSWIPPQLR